MELKNNWFRPAAYYLVKIKKHTQKEIARLFEINPDRISRAIKRFEETGSHENRVGKGRKRTARSEAVIEEARDHLHQNNHTKLRSNVTGNPSRKLASKLNISQTSAWRILRKDMELKPWKMQERQKLTDLQKRKRLELARHLKERFADGQHRKILFSDEK